jgi:prephenate dehydrogenase
MGGVAIVGYGRFGRALSGLVAEAGMTQRAFDPVADVPAPVRAPTLEDAVRGAELVVLAVPGAETAAAARAVATHLAPGAVVLDVGSVKVRPVEALATALGERTPWVATHPLFGPVSLSRAERPLRVVVCTDGPHAAAVERVCAFYTQLGCEVVRQTAEAHDRVMAYTHALTFFVAKGLIDAGADAPVAFSPPSFQAVRRVLEAVRGDAGHLFAAIQLDNPFSQEARAALLAALGASDKALRGAEPMDLSVEPSFRIPAEAARSPELEEARGEIDAVDAELVALLARRLELAQRAARAKSAAGQPVLDPIREAQVLATRRAWAAERGLDGDGAEAVFRAVLDLARQAQRG